MKIYTLLILLSLSVFLAFEACEDPIQPVARGALTFSADTIKFDSLFINFLSPSERFTAFNRTGNDILISRVWLENGDESDFTLIVDGRTGNDINEVEVAQDDSLRIFVNLKSNIRDDFAEDYLLFQIGDEVQRVLIRAFVVDAYYFGARLRLFSLDEETCQIDSLSFTGYFFRRDTVLTPEKPIIFDGPILIPPNVTVTIAPGTEIFFTPYKVEIDQCDGTSVFSLFSTLIVSGTLNAEGLPGASIVMQGTRLDEEFSDNPAQWRGVRFTQSSRNNILKHTLIKNASIGVEVDSVSFGDTPRLLMQHSQISNMSTFGVYGLGYSQNGLGDVPALVMENSIINNCGRAVAMIGGGNLGFYNCTIDNTQFAGRRQAQVFVSNFDTLGGNIIVYPTQLRMVNSVIWSPGALSSNVELNDEIGPYTPEEIQFDHCLIRFNPESDLDITPYLTNSLLNEDPLFEDASDGNFRPREGSPLIDMGKDLSARYLLDFRGSEDTIRRLPFDIGAFEYSVE